MEIASQKTNSAKLIQDEPIEWVCGVDHRINMPSLALLKVFLSDPVSGYDVLQMTFLSAISHALVGSKIDSDFSELNG